ncbi:eukaryotic translation initiation factor 3 [Ophiostoma piceae UAMH 11346]|uniref:Eukaryotic translation initiation factor 3 n=1 Tax=Ophiostoma piceae (strain UAMH 11346) TaxID=1262450 RepID=S3C975_OPHP1|nr:eukaryotic translation initiation factor 3 [Ophiostoma piceae UAMH 11346]
MMFFFIGSAPQCELGFAKTSTTSVLPYAADAYYFNTVTWLGMLVAVGVISVLFISLNALGASYTPSRRNLHQAPKSMYGLRPVINNPPPREEGVDIVFVHGLASNPDTTWLTKRGTALGQNAGDDIAKRQENTSPVVNWVTDLFPDDIPDGLKKSVRLFYYNYDSYWQRDAKDTRLSLLADELLDHLNNSIRSTPREKSRKLIFVAHCYGGLVVKQALVAANNHAKTSHITQRTIATVFLGTPHKGTAFSFLGRIQARVYRSVGLGASTVLLNDLADNSTVLMDLQKHYADLVGKNLRAINFFEQFGNVVLSVWRYKWRQFVVHEASATFFGEYVDNIGLGTDHRGLIKFGCRDNEYRSVCSKLVQVLELHARPEMTVFSVPLELTGNFTGRQALQEQLENTLKQTRDSQDYPHVVAATGMGGTGKSQLALSFAYTHKTEYNPILWIDATSEETVRASFQRCYNDLAPGKSSFTKHQDNHIKDNSTAPDLSSLPEVRAVLNWLKSRSAAAGDDPWLVIMDNTDDVSWGIGKVLPKGECGSLIITSQDIYVTKLIPKGCERVLVDTLDPLEASTLLLKHMGLDLESTSDTILEQCHSLTEKLGYLALAVNLAGCRIANEEDKEEGLSQYILDFESHRDDVLEDNALRGLTSYEKTTWTTWDASLRRIETLHGNHFARMLLMWLAHFTGTSIYEAAIAHVFQQFYKTATRERFEEYIPENLKPLASIKDGKWDDFYYRSSCKWLLRYGLIQRTKEKLSSVTIHKLVQWRALREAHGSHLSVLFFSVFDLGLLKVEDFLLDSRYLSDSAPSHNDVIDAIYTNERIKGVVTGFGFEQMYKSTERFDEHRELIACMERVSANGDENIRDIVLNRGRAMAIKRKRWDEAMDYHKKITELLVSCKDPATAEFLSAASLCEIYTEQGMLADAEACASTIQDGLENFFKTDGNLSILELSTPVRVLKDLRLATSQGQDAFQLWDRLIKKAALEEGEHSVSVLQFKREMVSLCLRMKDPERAWVYQQQVANATGTNKQLTLASLKQLQITVYLYAGKKQFHEAEKAAKEWLQHSQSFNMQGTEDTFTVLVHLVTVKLLQGECEEGKTHLDACVEWLSKDYPSCTGSQNIGWFCVALLLSTMKYPALMPYAEKIRVHLSRILTQRHDKELPTSRIVHHIKSKPRVMALYDEAFLDEICIC